MSIVTRPDFSAASPGFRKWTPIDAHYIDPRDAHQASIKQSKDTQHGVVAPFQLTKRQRLPYPDVEMTREPVPDCPQADQV